MDPQAFEKFENAIFFKIFKIPSNGWLEMVQNLPSFFLFTKSQQIRSLEGFQILVKMDRGWQADWVTAKIFVSI